MTKKQFVNTNIFKKVSGQTDFRFEISAFFPESVSEGSFLNCCHQYVAINMLPSLFALYFSSPFLYCPTLGRELFRDLAKGGVVLKQ